MLPQPSTNLNFPTNANLIIIPRINQQLETFLYGLLLSYATQKSGTITICLIKKQTMFVSNTILFVFLLLQIAICKYIFVHFIFVVSLSLLLNYKIRHMFMPPTVSLLPVSCVLGFTLFKSSVASPRFSASILNKRLRSS